MAQYRNDFLKKLQEYDKITITPDNLDPACPGGAEPILEYSS